MCRASSISCRWPIVPRRSSERATRGWAEQPTSASSSAISAKRANLTLARLAQVANAHQRAITCTACPAQPAHEPLAQQHTASAHASRPLEQRLVLHAGQSAQARVIAARLLALTEPENDIRVYLDAGEPM